MCGSTTNGYIAGQYQPHHVPIISLLGGSNVVVDMMHAFDSQTHPTPLLVYIATSSR